MRASACLWGGVYNPIIPVFKKPPKDWKPEVFDRMKGRDVAAGYLRFFEPDVYVETEKGLLEEAGLGALREKHAIHSPVITLKELFEPEDGKNWSEPEFGLNIHDVLGHVYKTEQQFVHRDKRESLLVSPVRGSALVEAMFGAYPTKSDLSYIQQSYRDVYKPEKIKATPEAWRKVYLRGAETPLRVTRHGLNTERHWYHDLVLFIFNPERATDLIDLWNLRLEPHPVLPVPVVWFEELSGSIYDLLKAQHRPIIGNPSGLMHNATVEFARSISKNDADALIRKLKPGLPQGALVVKHWRNRIWVDHHDWDRVHRDGRMKIVAEEKRIELALNENLRGAFPTVEPQFSGRFGKGGHRWMNVLRLSKYGTKSIATILPFNTFDRSWPRLGAGAERVAIGSEGWVFPQQFKNLSQSVDLLTTDDAISGSLERFGIKSKLSDPGHIAKQMLEHLGGLWGVHLLADIDTLKLLNKMAGGIRRKRNEEHTIEEYFELRSAPLKDWTDLIARRKTRGLLPSQTLEDFTQRNIIRVGLETECPHCIAKNWSTLTTVDYRVTCDRCLKPYDFPQSALRDHNRNWTYRVVGPFSVQDYGRGSYSALLALRVIDRFHTSTNQMTFATAMNLTFDGVDREVDFIGWRSEDRLGKDHPPQLVIGEAKSLGTGELITARDLARMKTVATKLPGAVVVFSVLRDHFTIAEKKLLTKFVTWGRRVNSYGEPTNPVLLLTSHELLMDFHISSTWKRLGGNHARFSDFEHTRNLLNFANASQQIYLGMPSFHQWYEAQWKKRLARRKAKAKPK